MPLESQQTVSYLFPNGHGFFWDKHKPWTCELVCPDAHGLIQTVHEPLERNSCLFAMHQSSVKGPKKDQQKQADCYL